jgi:hypothetical protein
MVRHCHIACKSTRYQPAGQLAPRDAPPLPVPQPESPRYVPQGEDSFEIIVIVTAGEDVQEAQHLPQNDDHDNDHEEEENNEEVEEEGNKAKVKDDENHAPLSHTEKDETYHDTDEIKTYRNEAPILTGRLRDLLNHLDITTPPECEIKRVPCPGREE